MAENQISTKFIADAEGFISAVKKIDRSLSVLQSQLKANKTAFDKNGNVIGNLAEKNNLLSKKIDLLKSKINTLSTAFTMEEGSTKKSAQTKQKFLDQLSKTMGKLIETQAEYDKNSKVLENYTSKQKDANNETEKAADDMKLLGHNAKWYENIDFSKVTETMKSVASGMKDGFKTLIEYAGKVKMAFEKIGTAIFNLARKALSFGKTIKSNFIEKSINYAEELNLFNVIFENIEKDGKTTFSELGKRATQFQNELQEAFGANKMESMRYQGLYQSMGESAGLSKEASYMMSENMTKLGYDLASLFNTSEKKAMESLRAGVFAGQTKPLRGYGIDVTQQTYKPILADLGIDKKVSELSQAEKEVLRYIVAIRQATKSQKDFADTIESPANQLKVLHNQIVEIGVAVGNFLVGPFQRALQVINGVAMALKAIINFFAKFFGIFQKQYNKGLSMEDQEDDMSDGLDDIGTSAGNATKKLKELHRQTLGFDQINNITSPTNSGSSGGGGTGGGNYGIDKRLLDAMSDYDNAMSKIQMRAVKIRDTIMEWLGFQKQINEETHQTEFTYDTTGKTLEQILTEIGGNAGKMLNHFTEQIPWEKIGETLATGLNSAFAFLNTFVQTYDFKTLGSDIAKFVNKAIENINFEGLGAILTNKLRVAILTLSGFIETLDFKAIGSAIGRTINGAIANIPVSDLVSGINNFVSGIFEAIKSLMKTLDWGAIIDSIMEIVKGLSWQTKLLILAPVISGGIKGLFNSPLVQAVIQKGTTELAGKIVAGMKGFSFSGMFSGISEAFSGLAASLGVSAGALLGIVAAIIAVGAAFVSAYKNNEEFRAKVDELVATIKEALLPVFEILKGALETIGSVLKDIWDNVITPLFNLLVDVLTPVFEVIIGVLQILFEKAIKPITKVLKELCDRIFGAIKDHIQRITGIIKIVIDTIDWLWQNILVPIFDFLWPILEQVGAFLLQYAIQPILDLADAVLWLYDNVLKPISDFLTAVLCIAIGAVIDTIEFLYDCCKKLIEWVKDKYNAWIKPIVDDVKNGINKMVSAIKGFYNDNIKPIIDKIKTKIDEFKQKWEDLKAKFKLPDLKLPKLPKIKLSVTYDTNVGKTKTAIYKALGLDGWPKLSFASYAKGGLPPMGQIFIANEAGPEMVGRIGKNNAVANNDQIVSAIRAGVYDAVSSAMNGNGFGTVDIQLHTDEGVVVDRINKITKQTGICPITI